jgi:hypothetical protein
MRRRGVDLAVAALTAALGLLAVVLPPLVLPGIRRYEAPLLPLVRTGVEGFSWLSLALLVATGGVAGLLRPGRPWRWGAASMLALPLIAIAEMRLDGTSHDLWPLEFACYGLGAIPAALGAHAAARLRHA